MRFGGVLLAALAVTAPAAAKLPVLKPVVVTSYPHDPGAFTEGLFFRDGKLYESTGYEGHSTIREVRLEDSAVLRSVSIPPGLFGEGIVDWGDQLISLTWHGGLGFRWSFPGFRQVGTFRYSGEGWGLTRTATTILMSDGTPVIRKLDPKTLKQVGSIRVTAEGRPVERINELEYVDGQILANIWETDRIARIDPASGRVTAWIDISGLPHPSGGARDAVANGIAWDAKKKRLFLTGKYWPALYEVKLR